jgi:calcineurin-like phosphoesterase family protein
MSEVWFTADTHFGHPRVIALARRPFADVRAMDEAMIRGWNEVVRPDDTVWHLGDFAFGKDCARVEAIFHRLTGRKHLLIGNHDHDNAAVLGLPWVSVSTLTSVVVEGTTIAMCHYPMKAWPNSRSGAIHLYGHMHGKLKGTSRSLDVGVDVWGFRPVTLAQIKRRLATLRPDPELDGPEDETSTLR